MAFKTSLVFPAVPGRRFDPAAPVTESVAQSVSGELGSPCMGRPVDADARWHRADALGAVGRDSQSVRTAAGHPLGHQGRIHGPGTAHCAGVLVIRDLEAHYIGTYGRPPMSPLRHPAKARVRRSLIVVSIRLV
jgi:hypothetical protein